MAVSKAARRSRRKRAPRQKTSIPVVAKLLWKHAGNMSEVARALGVTRQTISDFVANHPDELRPIVRQAKEQLVDWGESGLTYHLKKKRPTWQAIEFVLSTKGKKRGYTKQLQLAGGDPTEGALPIVIALPDNFRRPAVNHANGQTSAETPAQVGAETEGEPGGYLDDRPPTGGTNGDISEPR